MAPEPDTPRSQRSRAILSGDHRFTFAEWTKLGLDTKIGIAAARVPELLGEFAKLQHRPGAAARLADLVAEIAAWDQVGRNDSVATTFFVRMETLARHTGQIAALEQVKAALEAAFGTWKVAWGDVNRLQRVHSSGTEEQFSDARPSVPVPGAPSFTGTILTFGTREAPGQKRMYGTVGDTYVSVVEFGKRPGARSLLVLGESADPHSAALFRSGRVVFHAALQTRLVRLERDQEARRAQIPGPSPVLRWFLCVLLRLCAQKIPKICARRKSPGVKSFALVRYRRRYLLTSAYSWNSRRTRTRAPSWFSARALTPHPSHYSDQSELFSTQRFKPACIRLE